MADLRRVCPGCKRRFRPTKGTRRLYCETCRPPRSRAADEAPPPAGGADIVGPIEARLLADLQAHDRHETVDGLIALSVARDLDHDRVPPQQKPSVGEKLGKLRAKALEGTEPATHDRLDELAERRRAREAS